MKLAVVALSLVLASCQRAPDAWQYTIIAPSDSALKSEMDKMGAQGWELVSARRAANGDGDGRAFGYEMIFKKPGAAPDTFKKAGE